MPGAPELLEELYRKYRLYIVSNGTAKVQEGRIGSSGIAKYMDGIFISQILGANKPDKQFFDICFAEIPDFSLSETVIIGDSLSSDIKGGINAGITTVWFNPKRIENDSDSPAAVGRSAAITAHFMLPVSFFTVISVVEHGQWKSMNIITHMAVFMSQPFAVSSVCSAAPSVCEMPLSAR